MFLFVFVGTLCSQNIDESIPKFCEKIIALGNKETIKNDLLSRKFTLLSTSEMANLGIVNNDPKYIIVCGVGRFNIMCKVILYSQGGVASVTVYGVTYLGTQYVFDEFKKAGYEYYGKDGKSSTYIKSTDKYIYVGFLDVIVQKDGLINTTIDIGRRPNKK